MPTFPANPSRRQVLTLLGGVGGLSLLTIAGCGGGDDASGSSSAARQSGSGNGTTATTSGTTSTTAAASASTSCTQVPQETAGPYPGDGSNGPNALTQNGVVRSDLRSSFGPYSGTASGLPLTLTVTVLDLANGCKPLKDAAIYAWHCDGAGLYSMYSQGATNQNWCRGVQATDSSGAAKFTTVFPGAYAGRYPHIHFEVYSSVAGATGGGAKLITSQLAMPDAACTAVYATSGYEASARNYPQTPISRDGIFSDGYAQQMATVTGTPSSGMASTLTIAVSSAA